MRRCGRERWEKLILLVRKSRIVESYVEERSKRQRVMKEKEYRLSQENSNLITVGTHGVDPHTHILAYVALPSSKAGQTVLLLCYEEGMFEGARSLMRVICSTYVGLSG